MQPLLPRALPPLSLYVHIPWCEKKCPYCDFNSHVNTQALPEAEYVEALIQDLRSQQSFAQGRPLASIFFGGGTPSLFSADAIATIIRAAEHYFDFSDDIEITLEANPGSSENKKFAGFAQAGVNRISLGVQSFDNAQLERLGRIHNHDDIHRAVEAIKQAGIQRFNLDLMHGLPEQTPEQAMHDLQQAVDLGAEHISWYQLTIEQNTQFFRSPPILPVEDDLADIQDQGFELLASHGFTQYEISAFSKTPAQRSRHNLNYWQFGDYLAIGAG
ncbi:MAG: radical SAM family heme chaperone HemW, partial [Sinobacterium sp.]|nr:radical SAM family heme chaperone HemW [Sinobacterium sp.]